MLRELLFGIKVVAKDDKRAGRDPSQPGNPVYMMAYDQAALETPYENTQVLSDTSRVKRSGYSTPNVPQEKG